MPDLYAVMGLDLSITATGVCPFLHPSIEDEPYTVKFGTGKNAPKGDFRLHMIRQAIADELDRYDDVTYDLAVIEALPPYGKGSASLGLVHGVARELLASRSVPVIYVSPSPLKKFVTGDGRASKDDMIEQTHIHTDLPKGLDDNAVDAFWLQQVGLKYLGGEYVKPDGEADGYDVLEKVKLK